MWLEWFIGTYGYLAVLIGTALEGETVLILAGFAAHSGYLDLGGVIATAFAGTLVGDEAWFFLGRWHGAGFVARRPHWQARVAGVQAMFRRYQTVLILGFRFLYGVRTVTPFALGMSGVSVSRFVMLNVLSAATWSILVGCAGYTMGTAIETVLGDVRRYEFALFLGILTLAGLVYVVRLVRGRRPLLDLGRYDGRR